MHFLRKPGHVIPQMDWIGKTSPVVRVSTHIYGVFEGDRLENVHFLSKLRHVTSQIDCLGKTSTVLRVSTDIYRWVPLKPDFLGAWKSVWLKHYPAYPIIITSLIIQRNLATKIRAKWESGLTTVRLKRDPPVWGF